MSWREKSRASLKPWAQVITPRSNSKAKPVENTDSSPFSPCSYTRGVFGRPPIRCDRNERAEYLWTHSTDSPNRNAFPSDHIRRCRKHYGLRADLYKPPEGALWYPLYFWRILGGSSKVKPTRKRVHEQTCCRRGARQSCQGAPVQHTPSQLACDYIASHSNSRVPLVERRC